ncbi:unnamed protein product [Symbiodinium sp. CCMP2592]|nr:unnamed protein product [Symbiodinium sp. CCMP2592]
MCTALEGWPNETWPEFQEIYHNPEDKLRKPAFKAARVMRKKLGIMSFRWSPPSKVTSSVCRARKVFCDVAFMSEAEVLKYFKVTAKQLGLTIGSLQLEDRREMLRGYYVSLAGVPAHIVHGLRKVRLSWKVKVKHAAMRLQPEWQIRQEQGGLMFNHFSDLQLGKADAKVRTVNRAKLVSFESLLQKGGNINQVLVVVAAAAVVVAEENAGQAAAGGEQQEGEADEGEQGEEEEMEVDLEMNPDDSAAFSAFRSAPSHGDAFMEDGGEGPKKKKRVSKPKVEPEEEEDDGVVDGGSSDIPQWLQKDSALQKVIAKLGKVHKCFLSMDPQRNLDCTKSPAGRQLRGAMPARMILQDMEAKNHKEASLLSSRLRLLEHVEALAHTSLASMTRAEVRAHVTAVVDEGLQVPASLKTQLLERWANDLFGDMMEVKDVNGADFKASLDAYMLTVCAFIPTPADVEITDLNLTAAVLWTAAREEVDYKVKFGTATKEAGPKMVAEIQQASADAVLEGLFCDSFVKMVKDVHIHKDRLLKVLSCFLLNYTDEAKELLESKEPLKSVYDRFQGVAFALVALMSPEPDYLASNATHVNAVMKYRGSNVFETTIRDHIVRKGDKENPNMWTKLYDDFLAKAEETAKLWPKLQDAFTTLADMEKAEPLSLNVGLLVTIVQDLPQMKKSMRHGVCNDAFKKLQSVLKHFLTAVLKAKAGEISLGTSSVTSLQAGVALFPEDASMTRLGEQWQKFRKNSEKEIALTELLDICKSYPTDYQAPMQGNIGPFLDAWKACPMDVKNGLQDDDLHVLNSAICWIYRVVADLFRATWLPLHNHRHSPTSLSRTFICYLSSDLMTYSVAVTHHH